MQASVLQENLRKGLSTISRAICTRPTLPVLSHVLVEAREQALFLVATDLEMFITCTISAKVEEKGEITVPGRLFVDLVNSLPPARVDLELVGDKLHIECESNKADLNGIPAMEFPIVPEMPDSAYELDAGVLKTSFGRASIAVATDESRPVLTGAYVKLESDSLTTAAADGFRLSVCSAELSDNVNDSLQAIVPGKAVKEFVRLVDDQDVGIAIDREKGRIWFSLVGTEHDITIISQLLEGTFVNYQNIVPKSYETRVILDTEKFTDALKSVRVLGKEDADSVTLTITSPIDENTIDGIMVLEASAVESGTAKVALDAKVEGPAETIKFNGRYLLDALGVMDTPQVCLEVTYANNPGVLKMVGKENEFTHVIMPMHVR